MAIRSFCHSRVMLGAFLIISILLPLFFSANSRAQKENPPALRAPYVSAPVAPADTTGLPLASNVEALAAKNQAPLERPVMPLPKRGFASQSAYLAPEASASLQNWQGTVTMPAPLTNWEGIPLTGVLPPDTNGQAGLNHYVQIVNASSGAQVRVWNKSGAQLYDFGLQNLWPSNDVCRIDALGDPVVLYDQLADRWILTQFALPDPPYYECIAVSKAGAPTDNPGDWHLYSFKVHDAKMNDYPKLGVWPDGYYMSANQFYTDGSWAGAGVWVFDRDAMLNGDAASFQYFDLSNLSNGYGGLLPSNLMGDALPPSGAPNYFMSIDMNWSGSDDTLHIFEFHVDWNTPANSSFTFIKDIVVDPFNWDFDGSGGSRDNWDIPQPDTSVELDSLSDRLMMHLWYRNFGDHESLVVNHTVNVGDGSDHAGVRWYEIRGGAVDATLADAVIYQQGTYAPDSDNRWMGSVAMDHVGDLAIGYSVSSTSVHPSIRYAGRLAGDPLGTLPQAEAQIIAGGGSQTHTAARWGDYSSLTVDPADDCTFWYATEYIASTTSAHWQTRVGSFKFDACTPDFTLSASPASQSVCAGNDALYTIAVGSAAGFSDPVTLSASGQPAASAAAFAPNPVTPPGDSAFTISNTVAAAAGNYAIDITGNAASITHTASVALTLFDEIAAASSLSSPADGATNVVITPTLTWDATANAESYTLAIATDSAFSNIIHIASAIPSASYTLTTALSANTLHYWRVRADNVCGSGPWSNAFSFSTENIICSAPNASIPDNDASGVSDVINVTTSNTLQDLDITLDISHAWVGNLGITLEHLTTGTAVTLMDQPGAPASTNGCGGDDINATIDDYGPDGDAEAMCDNAPAIHGRIRGGDPANGALLAAFNGENISGDWRLTVSDHADGNIGQVTKWCLTSNRCMGATSDVTDLGISRSGNNVHLSWADTGASSYIIYRTENDPYFTPDASNELITIATSHYDDAVLGDSSINYNYKVRGVNVCPPPASYTERAGEFDFTLVSGK